MGKKRFTGICILFSFRKFFIYGFEMTQPKLLLLLLLPLISATLIAQSPSAEIVNSSSEICESGNITLSIKFSGSPPFGIRYKIGNVTFTKDDTNLIHIEDMSADFVWESPETIDLDIPAGEASKSVVIEILEVYDITISAPWDQGAGTTITDQSITYTSWKMPVPNAGNDIDSCGLKALLDATPDPISNTFGWQNPAQGSVSDTRDANALFTATAEGTYQLTLVQDNGVCQAQDQVEVVLKGSPSGSLSTISEVCGTSTQNATLDFGFTGNGPWDYTISNGAETVTFTATAPLTSQTLPVNGETTFTFTRIMDINGCRAAPQQLGGSATVIDLEPSPNAGNDLEVCATEVALEGIAGSYPGVWSGPSGISFDDATAPNTNVTSLGYGNYTLTWTEINGTCSASDEVVVRFDQSPTPVNAGEDMKLYHEYETTLNAQVPLAGEGLWAVISGPGQLTSPENPSAQISGLEMGNTTLLWTVTNGVCAAITDTLVITVEGLTYFNGFSPNGDGYNDSFRILGASEIPNNELIVFNLQGKVVYREKNMTDAGWDGKDMSGSPLDDGNYYFVFTGDRINAVKDYLVIKTR